MLVKYNFRDDVKKITTLINGKRYSDTGMMWEELSQKIGIDIDTLMMYDNWYILDDGFYYFKYACCFQELFMSELASECGVKCVEYKLAENYDIFEEYLIGIISKLYREKDKNYYVYSDFCWKYFNKYIDDLGNFRLSSEIAFGNDKTNKLMNEIFGMISFDMFTGQYDRFEHNFFFECDKDNVGLAPLCDNGLVFCSGRIYSSPFGKFSLFYGDNWNIPRQDLLNLIKREEMLYDRFDSLLDIDVKEVLGRTLDKYMIIMDKGSKKKVLKYLDDRKRAIDYTLKLCKR